jgi:hypothetical protein
MTLPVAVVERWPMEEYRLQHKDLVSALKHNVADALKCLQEIEQLRHLHSLHSNTDSKENKRVDKNFDTVLREKEERYLRLTKFSDYPAMVMAAYPQSQFVPGNEYKREKDSCKDPILVRGISAGSFINHAAYHKRDYYFMETGYLGNYRSANNTTGRKVYHRIEKNAMQQRRFLDVPYDRWEELCKFDPRLTYRGWRKPGKNILLIMNTDKPFNYYGVNRDQWIQKTIATIQAHTDRPIVIREKVGRAERVTTDTIYDALDKDVWALVTFNSIAAVEAIQSGIPAFALAPTAAAPVASADLTQIENPYRPHEDIVMKWLASVAYGQFSIDEIVRGQAWRMVQENEQRPTFTY